MPNVNTSEFNKITAGIIITMVLAIAGFGTSWMTRIETRMVYIGDNYATKTELKRIDTTMNSLRVEVREMLTAIRDEIRYDREKRTEK